MAILEKASSKLSPLQISFGMHLVIFAVAIATQFNLLKVFRSEKVDIEVLVAPKTAPANLNLQVAPKPKEIEKPKEIQKKVFGLNRKAITTTEDSPTTATVKVGNTVAKENDNLKLEANDPDSIPIPTDDYLVTSQPALLKDIKIPYPEEAKKAGIEGPVVMNLLIDKNGKVRDVKLVKGPGFGLNEAAEKAVLDFVFRPAKVNDQSVAVLIRYTYRFVLEIR